MGISTLSTFATTHFSGSGVCASCHSSLYDRSGADVSIDTHWRATTMANSAQDPLWQAKVSSEVARQPALRDAIEYECSPCHMPMARTQAAADGTPITILDSGFLSATNPLHAPAMDGVSCTLCHQIEWTGLGEAPSFSGGYLVDTTTRSPSRRAFGPFAQPQTNMMRMRAGFTPLAGSQTMESALCGTCHVLYSPYVDAGGTVRGHFPEQTTYLEWLHSSYGNGLSGEVSCQECHLPSAVGGVVLANRGCRCSLGLRSPFGQHFFVGANTFMLQLLGAHTADLGLTATSSQFQATLSRTRDQLQSSTAGLSITSVQRDGGILAIGLRAENWSGHKLPSGIPARRLWVHLVVSDARGQTVFESGQPQPDGSIAGNAADESPDAWEPHYAVISDPGQVQIYEPIMQTLEGDPTYTLLRGAAYAKDNRLLPAGFNKSSASPDIGVWGEAASDVDFVGGSDQLAYRVPVQGWAGPLTVSAELLYQAVSYRFVQDLRRDSTPLVNRFVSFYEAADRSPAVLAALRWTVP
jgi:hypothetical protein